MTEPGTEVAVRDQPIDEALGGHLPQKRELNALWHMADNYAAMPGLAKQFAGNQKAVMAALLTAWSLDLPTTPLIINQFYEVQGRLFPSTQLLIALANRAGIDLWFSDDSDSRKATAYCARHGSQRPANSYTYTIEDAQKAKLTGKDVWQQHADIMLRYRAASRLLRTVAADVVLGIPTFVAEGSGVVPVDRAALEAGAVAVEVSEDAPGGTSGTQQALYDERPFTEG